MRSRDTRLGGARRDRSRIRLLMTITLSLYEVLGVPPDADATAIRRAWRRLARANHPDVNGGDEAATAQFQAAVTAYRILGHPERRIAYDRERGAERTAGEHGTSAARLRRRIPDRATCLEIPYSMNVQGGVLRVTIPGVGRCGGCAGRGWREAPRCPACDGAVAPEGSAGRPACGRCGGSARGVDTCERCGGAGFAVPTRVHELRLEPGVLDGASVRIPDAGWPSALGGRGDLVVRLTLADAPGMWCEGTDLCSEARVRRSVAHRGGLVTAPGAEGPHQFRIPPRTADGTRFDFGGLGLRSGAGGPRGSLRVTVRLA
jgi:molecular chaperone DnaJ